MSYWPTAIVAAKRAVTAPIIATMYCAAGAAIYSGAERATRYTPAVTIVAAWIRAETGVGPAIASGNHVRSGICADLPVAPRKNNNAMAVAPNAAPGRLAACSRKLDVPFLLTKLIVPKAVKTRNVAIIK